MSVAIIGTGLSGLCLALTLNQNGIPCTVYESRPSPLNLGGAVMLSPNALKILDTIGVYSRVKDKGYNFEKLEFRNASNEFQETYEFGNEGKYGYKALRIYRTDLIEEMLRTVKMCGISVEFNKKFVQVVEEDSEGVTWELADGSTQRSKLLVGADGIHSTVRKYLYPNLKTRFTGMVGITAAIPTSQLQLPPDYFIPATITTRNFGAFVIAPQSPDGSECLIGRQRRMPETDRVGWDRVTADKEDIINFMQSDMEHFPLIAQNAVSNIPPKSINVWPFYVVPKLDKWASEKHHRVVILGDAAHAIPPSAGQGINQAFEDVYTFTLLLLQERTVGIENALSFWQKYRQERVDRVLDLNQQIDVRRMPADQVQGIDKKEIELSWLYGADFKKDVDDWVSQHRK